MAGYLGVLKAVGALTGALTDVLCHMACLLVGVGGLVVAICELLVNLGYITGRVLLWVFLQSYEGLDVAIKWTSQSLVTVLREMTELMDKLVSVCGINRISLPSSRQISGVCVETTGSVFKTITEIIMEVAVCVANVMQTFTSTLSSYVVIVAAYSTTVIYNASLSCLAACLWCYQSFLDAATQIIHYAISALSTFISVIYVFLASICVWCYETSFQVMCDVSATLTLEYYFVFLLTLLGVLASVFFVNHLHVCGFPLFLSCQVQEVVLDDDQPVMYIESDVDEETDVETTSSEDEESLGEMGDDDDEEEEEDEEDDEVIDVSDTELTTADTDSEIEELDIDNITINLPAPSRGRDNQRTTPARDAYHSLQAHELERRLVLERDQRLCVVCQDRAKTVLILPCKHMCLCVDCAHEISKSRPAYRRVCPLCRKRIETVMYVYV